MGKTIFSKYAAKNDSVTKKQKKQIQIK